MPCFFQVMEIVVLKDTTCQFTRQDTKSIHPPRHQINSPAVFSFFPNDSRSKNEILPTICFVLLYEMYRVLSGIFKLVLWVRIPNDQLPRCLYSNNSGNHIILLINCFRHPIFKTQSRPSFVKINYSTHAQARY